MNRRIKSFDEVLKTVKKENYDELKKRCENLEGIEKLRLDAIIEMKKFDEGFKITNKSKKILKEEKDDTLIYKCDKPSYIEENDKRHFNTIKIEASDVVKVASELYTEDLELKNLDSNPLHGRIVFENKQKAKSLIIKDTAVKGKFNVSNVSIGGMTYLDLYLDALSECEHTELLIRPDDEENRRNSLFADDIGKNIRGSINLSINFYNKLSKENKLKLLIDGSAYTAHILIRDIPIYIYNNIKIKKIDIEEARRQLMKYKPIYGMALSADVEFERR